MAKKISKALKDASWARLPRIDSITVMQAQFFDNRATAAGVKGKSDFTLKLFVWTAGWNIDTKKPEWWRVVQLVEPRTVLLWARKKHEAGDMDADMFGVYEEAAEQAIELAKDDDFELVRMGHISSPPGTQYFIGQFVFIAKQKDGQFRGFVYNNGEFVKLDTLKPTKKAGRYRKPGTPTHGEYIKGKELLARQREAQAKLEEREAEARQAPAYYEPPVDDQFRNFMSRSPFL